MTGLTSILGGENHGLDPVERFGPGPVLRIAYRRKLIQALNVKLRAGDITRAEYWRIRRASYNPRFISAFIDEIENAAKAAGDFLDDVQAWLKALYAWLIENWDTVLKIALTLLMFVI